MLNDLQLFGLGAAAVVDTVLLMALLEQPNRRHVTVWMIALTAAAWLWHAGSFIHTLLFEATHSWPLQVNAISMTAMTAGLLLMPSSLLHGAIRLWHTGIAAKPRGDARYGLCYLPVLTLGPIARGLFAKPIGEFLTLVAPFVAPYVAWLCVTNLFAAATFWRLRRRVTLPHSTPFFKGMAVTLCGLSVLAVFVIFVAIPRWPQHAEEWKLVAGLSPVLPALLFAYHVMRFGFVPLVLERTLVYGAVLAAVFLFHHVALADVTNRLSERLQVDFAIIEAVAAAVFIVAYQPLRQRVAEALRYLLGTRVADVREEARRLSARMTELTDQPLDRATEVFSTEMRNLFGVEHAGVRLFGDKCLTAQPLPPSLTNGMKGREDQSVHREESVAWLRQQLAASSQKLATRRDAPNHEVSEWLTANGCSAAMLFEHHGLCGLLLLGRKSLNQDLSAEEVNSFALLTEQFAIALHNTQLQQDRLNAERRALRQEKLSTLGLLASSIAHEVKNPLSSIRTIAMVMAEDLGPESPHAEDLRLVISEIDRLATTTRQLLEFARPSPMACDSCVPRELLERTLRILRQLAQQKGVRLETDFEDGAVPINADPAGLGEVFFNLLSNSIDAAGSGGLVAVSCRTKSNAVTILIRDTGPGLPPEVLDHLFEPFFTTKLDGTGLGLYIVGRRIRELGAEIRCESTPGQGTSFEMRLPI